MIMDANRTSPVYELKDELARYCLPQANRDSNRKLAWVNSICILFLIIGLAGAKPGAISLRPPPPLPAEIIPVIIEPTPPPPTSEETPKEQPKEIKAEAPNVVVAVPDSPAVLFSVATVANVVAPSGVPTTPPLNPMRPVEALRNRPATLIISGGSERPAPDYPAYFQDRGEHGSVTFLITVNQSGIVTDIKVAHSTGFPDLDEYTLKQIKKRWIIPPMDGNQLFQTTINFVP
jgi:periplasmic protein TonB